MRYGRLGMVAMVLGSATMIVVGVKAEDVEKRHAAILIEASPAILPVGALCTVELKPERNGQVETRTAYEGQIVEVNDDGITLTVVRKENRRQQNTRYLSEVPVLNRLFTNIGIGIATPEEPEETWVPVEQIRSVRILENQER